MRIVLQRVKEASVTIDGEVHGAINKGYMILVGFNNDDTHEIIDRLVENPSSGTSCGGITGI